MSYALSGTECTHNRWFCVRSCNNESGNGNVIAVSYRCARRNAQMFSGNGMAPRSRCDLIVARGCRTMSVPEKKFIRIPYRPSALCVNFCESVGRWVGQNANRVQPRIEPKSAR